MFSGHGKEGDGHFGKAEDDLIKCGSCGESLEGRSVTQKGGSWGIACSQPLKGGGGKRCWAFNVLTETSSSWGQKGQTWQALERGAELTAAAKATAAVEDSKTL